MNNKSWLLCSFQYVAGFTLLLCSCYRVPDQIDPKVSYALQGQHFERLPAPFPPLSQKEKEQNWGKEMLIGQSFAQELDLYRAISTFRRAQILLKDTLRPEPDPDLQIRLNEIEYEIVLCYFIAKKYDEAIESFEKTKLAHVDRSFPAYHDLLLVLYECYQEVEDVEKQDQILKLLHQSYPDTAEKITLSQAIRQGDLAQVDLFAQGFCGPSYLGELLDTYQMQKKSVSKAQLLNALIPGAGYFYIGQKKSAWTAFMLNSLFIVAAYQFFHHGHTAAGIITTGFEAGWYFGGIYGAGEEAKYYNERIYEKMGSTVLQDQKLFPILMLQHAF